MAAFHYELIADKKKIGCFCLFVFSPKKWIFFNRYLYRQVIIFFQKICGLVWFMVFNATFNNISVISWRSVLLVEEDGVPGENHRPFESHWQTLSHNVVSPRHERGSNYHTIMTQQPLKRSMSWELNDIVFRHDMEQKR
jgi:hypothetical protein